jgi:hypothetical protein
MLTSHQRCIVGLRYGPDLSLRTRCHRPLAHAGRHEAFGTDAPDVYELISWVPRDPNEYKCTDQLELFAWVKGSAVA